MGLFSRVIAPSGPRPGTVWTGGYARCEDRTLVEWPGIYGTRRNGYGHEVIDPLVKLEFADDGVTLVVIP